MALPFAALQDRWLYRADRLLLSLGGCLSLRPQSSKRKESFPVRTDGVGAWGAKLGPGLVQQSVERVLIDLRRAARFGDG